MDIRSWGGLRGEARNVWTPAFSGDTRKIFLRESGLRSLVIGNLRSYGDEVLSPEGRYLSTARCDRIMQLDAAGATVTAESGIRLDVLERRLAPLGLMIPVMPGTSLLSLGGAIANDVHGKNHHSSGTFGRFVRRLQLIRTNGETLLCSDSENTELFAATIGGLGLTGAIAWATIGLRRISSPILRIASRRIRNLSEFFDIDAKDGGRHEYTVAWIDCLAKGDAMGRGIYSVADFAGAFPPGSGSAGGIRRPRIGVPFALPVSPVNSLTVGAMNSLYYRTHRIGSRDAHFRDWLYPLDAIADWNRLYGRRGFYQFQCVIPTSRAHRGISDLLKIIALRGQGSFLAVLKTFGDKPSPGLMSFPMPGATLALDFPNRGPATQELLLELCRITMEAGGRLYPAKDAHSGADSLKTAFPNFERFKSLIDPGLESVMSRRLQLTS
jgi:FAD/FMN-containing dehydrogenase